MRNDPRGSIWRQWDLHLHTPSSYDYRNGSISDEAFIDRLISEGLAAVAITDHHKIDVCRIRNLRQIAGDRLIVFPGIELRSELGGSQSVHYIGVFAEEPDLEELWKKVEVKLKISTNEVREKSDDRVYVPFREGASLIRELGGIVSVHAGRKVNSIEHIANAEEFKQEVKVDLVRDFIDVLEIGSVKDEAGYRSKVFPYLGFSRPLIIGSDNHDVSQYQRKAKCWIKADLTFEGLRHVMHEPESRVFLGNLPHQVEQVRTNRTKYIRSISVQKCAESNLAEEWFSVKVDLAHGLAAIIGNKGSGKSALADVTGLLGDSHRGASFSFLHPDKFRRQKGNKAKHFGAEITWESDGTAHRNLDDAVDTTSPESVRYIPQAYLEKICNDLRTGKNSDFTQELKAVMYSHINEADRLGHEDLDSLLNYRTGETAAAQEHLRRDLLSAIEETAVLEGKLSQSYRKTLENQLDMKERELGAHDTNRPTDVPKPDDDPRVTETNATLELEIAKLRQEMNNLDEEISNLNTDRRKYSRRIAAADRLLTRLSSLETAVQTFCKDSADDCTELGIGLDSIFHFEVVRQPVVRIKEESAEKIKNVLVELDPAAPNGRVLGRSRKENEVQEKLSQMGEAQQRYQRYLADTKTWNQRRADIVGNPELSGTLKYFQNQIATLSAVPAALEQAQLRCREATMAIYRQITVLAEAYRSAFKPVQDFINTHQLAQDRLHLEFDAAIKSEDFEERFLRLINQGKRGSFHGGEDGAIRVRQLVRKADFNSEQGVLAFLDDILMHLQRDMRQPEPIEISIESQLKGATISQLYELLFSLDYLKPQYSLRWAGKDIEQLSPGERGTLLMVFYLLIDPSDVPLIIDQPEENLDNQTVYDVLVPSIKEAKCRRQIVIVTHNPNLAVVCDADQIIHASIDKDHGNRITYTSGALENPEISRKVVDVLEGTRPAFDNRKQKYYIFDGI